MALNGIEDRVFLYNYALSDEVAEGSDAASGTLEMKAHESMITVGLATLGDGSRIGRSLAASGQDGIADVLAKEQRSFAVKTRVLDDLKLKPDLIKVDVEGGEYLVLAGARATLLAYMPIVVMELVRT